MKKRSWLTIPRMQARLKGWAVFTPEYKHVPVCPLAMLREDVKRLYPDATMTVVDSFECRQVMQP